MSAPLPTLREGRKARRVKRAAQEPVVPRKQKLTPPCTACRYPLLAGEARCPRCGHEVQR